MPYYTFRQKNAHGVYVNIQEWRADPSPDLDWTGPFTTIDLARQSSYPINHAYDQCRMQGYVQFDNNEDHWWLEIVRNTGWTVVALLDELGVLPRNITKIPDGVLFLDKQTYVIWMKADEFPLEPKNMPPVEFLTEMLIKANVLL